MLSITNITLVGSPFYDGNRYPTNGIHRKFTLRRHHTPNQRSNRLGDFHGIVTVGYIAGLVFSDRGCAGLSSIETTLPRIAGGSKQLSRSLPVEEVATRISVTNHR